MILLFYSQQQQKQNETIWKLQEFNWYKRVYLHISYLSWLDLAIVLIEKFFCTAITKELLDTVPQLMRALQEVYWRNVQALRAHYPELKNLLWHLQSQVILLFIFT